MFSNNLIAATASGGVYVIDAHTNVTELAYFNIGTFGATFEGVTTITNDTAKYGPWAGKILAAAEAYQCIFSVDTNGAAAYFNFNIIPEDIQVITTNQDFYLNDVSGQILKLPRRWLTNYVGDVLVTQEVNPITGTPPSEIFILHRDAGSTNFVKHGIRSPAHTFTDFEQGTFAPITVPSTPMTD